MSAVLNVFPIHFNYPTSIVSNGVFTWVSNRNNNITVIDIQNQKVVNNLNIASVANLNLSYPSGMTYSGNYLWVVNNVGNPNTGGPSDYIVKMTYTGQNLYQVDYILHNTDASYNFNNLGCPITDGVDVWVSNRNNNQIVEFSVYDGSLVGFVNCTQPNGWMFYDSSYIWALYAPSPSPITKINKSNNALISTYGLFGGINTFNGDINDNGFMWINFPVNSNTGITRVLPSPVYLNSGALANITNQMNQPRFLTLDNSYIWLTNLGTFSTVQSGSYYPNAGLNTITQYDVSSGNIVNCMKTAQDPCGNFQIVNSLNSEINPSFNFKFTSTLNENSACNIITNDASYVWVINATNSTVTQMTKTPSNPGGSNYVYNYKNDIVQVAPQMWSDNSYVWLTQPRGGPDGSGSVIQLNPATGTVARILANTTNVLYQDQPNYQIDPRYQFLFPYGITCDGSSVWISNSHGNSVTQIDKVTGNFIAYYSNTTDPSYSFNVPVSMTSDSSYVWVCNYLGPAPYDLSFGSITQMRKSDGTCVANIDLSGHTNYFANHYPYYPNSIVSYDNSAVYIAYDVNYNINPNITKIGMQNYQITNLIVGNGSTGSSSGNRAMVIPDFCGNIVYVSGGANNTSTLINRLNPKTNRFNNTYYTSPSSSPYGTAAVPGYVLVNYVSGIYQRATFTDGSSGLLTNFNINTGTVGFVSVFNNPLGLSTYITSMSASPDSSFVFSSGSNGIIQFVPGTPLYTNGVAPPSVICFNKGTLILCIEETTGQEEYVAIEDLPQDGWLVQTYLHGPRRVHAIGSETFQNNSRWNEAMYVLRKTNHAELMDDLIVTGGHSLLVDKEELTEAYLQEYRVKNVWKTGEPLQIDDKYFLLASVDKRFERIINSKFYTIYHLALENDGNDDQRYGVWANGVLTETISVNQYNQLFSKK